MGIRGILDSTAGEIKGNVGLEGGFGISAKPSTHKASLKGGRQHSRLADVAPPQYLEKR